MGGGTYRKNNLGNDTIHLIPAGWCYLGCGGTDKHMHGQCKLETQSCFCSWQPFRTLAHKEQDFCVPNHPTISTSSNSGKESVYPLDGTSTSTSNKLVGQSHRKNVP